MCVPCLGCNHSTPTLPNCLGPTEPRVGHRVPFFCWGRSRQLSRWRCQSGVIGRRKHDEGLNGNLVTVDTDMSRDTISGGRVTSPRPPNLLLLPLSSITFSLPLVRRPRARVSRLYDGSPHRLCTLLLELFSYHCLSFVLFFFLDHNVISKYPGGSRAHHCYSLFQRRLSLCQKKKKENHGSFAFFSLIVTKTLLYEQCGRRGRYTRLRIWDNIRAWNWAFLFLFFS
ncbi:hypothetical protein V8C44DRAFT_294064 [Trichoderma aethiopicum]